MLKCLMTVSILLAGIGLSTAVLARGEHLWSYWGTEGPEHWAELDVKYASCSGFNQSPINLTGMLHGNLPPITVNYKPGGYEVINNGHTIQVNYRPGSFIELNNHRYELKQYHLHSPSENTIEGRRFPMEAHFVHQDENGNLAVIAVMIIEGKSNPELEKSLGHIPAEIGGVHKIDELVNADVLLDGNRDYYRFNGSLTTPPCTEGVLWLVLKHYDEASKEQIEAFSETVHKNNRPLQPLNTRIIVD